MLRFSCEKALLQSAVNTTSRAVAAKSSIPALEGILLEGGDTLTLSGQDITGLSAAATAACTLEVNVFIDANTNGESAAPTSAACPA